MFQSLLLTAALSGSVSLKTEVQVNICESFNSLSAKLDLGNWKKKKSEQSLLVENRELFLYKRGWVFKAKLANTSTVEITLKKNAGVRRIDESSPECEYDLHGELKKMACKLSQTMALADFQQQSAAGNFSALLSRQQLDWLKSDDVELPQNLELTSAFLDEEYGLSAAKYDLGVTTNASGREFIEISTRADSQIERQKQTELLQFLRDRGVSVCADQSAIQTRNKLDSFFNP